MPIPFWGFLIINMVEDTPNPMLIIKAPTLICRRGYSSSGLTVAVIGTCRIGNIGRPAGPGILDEQLLIGLCWKLVPP